MNSLRIANSCRDTYCETRSNSTPRWLSTNLHNPYPLDGSQCRHLAIGGAAYPVQCSNGNHQGGFAAQFVDGEEQLVADDQQRLIEAESLAQRLDRPMGVLGIIFLLVVLAQFLVTDSTGQTVVARSEEHTSELQSRF